MEVFRTLSRSIPLYKALMLGAAVITFIGFVLTITVTANTRNWKDATAISACIDGVPPVDYAAAASGFCVHQFASGLNVPRKMVALLEGELIVVETGAKPPRITMLWDDDGNGQSTDDERAILAEADGLTGELALHQGYLYASSDTQVLRWPYAGASRNPLGNFEVVVSEIPQGGHSTRSMVFDSMGNLYVSVGSYGNVDTNSLRAMIRRFDLSQPLPLHWTSDGIIFAHGMRNEVGLRFDAHGTLWGVENGVDNVDRQPWGDVHNDNPAEELNSFGNPLDVPDQQFYGYPYCWSEYQLSGGQGAGTQWAHPAFWNQPALTISNDWINVTDAWCQNTSNVVPPALAMPAHVAPVDILFYYGVTWDTVNAGDAFVSWHGSWNRDKPQGYKVVQITFDQGKPHKWKPFFYYASHGDVNGQTEVDKDSNWPHRPVGLAMGKCIGSTECLFVSSDETGIIAMLFPMKEISYNKAQS